ncbi:MAG: tripartite tricarboxylate transporter substrate binding protein [Burkholderiales bacterium]|jgi:tripartite-type tricarboxylate transporter receptor subunit TctC|nr:tripartite tricarboxylate transporter substrate binding protein [Burkholderiales bacterium]
MTLKPLKPLKALAAAIAALACAAAGLSHAAFPEKTVRIVVPFAPGGATDVVARALGQRLGKVWNQQVIIENKPGAGGNIGADIVAKAAPDGHTLLMASPAEVVINQFLYAKMPFDPATDLVPISKAASAPLVLVVHPSVPSTTLPELIDWLKARPEGTNYASSGTGGPQHLAGESFRTMTKAKLVHVPYKGGAPAITDLLGGQVQMFFAGLPPALPHIRAGKIRAIAITTTQPSALIPGVPTVASVLPGFDFENWQGLFAPKGTPAAIVEQIARDYAAVADKSLADQLSGQGAAPAPTTPADFAAFVQKERQKYGELVKASGAKVD